MPNKGKQRFSLFFIRKAKPSLEIVIYKYIVPLTIIWINNVVEQTLTSTYLLNYTLYKHYVPCLLVFFCHCTGPHMRIIWAVFLQDYNVHTETRVSFLF